MAQRLEPTNKPGLYRRGDVAVESGMIARNPANGIERIRVGAKRLLLPSQEEFKKLVETIRSNKKNGYRHHNADVVEFLAYSGLRISEARAVTWSDVLKDQIGNLQGCLIQSRKFPSYSAVMSQRRIA